MVSAMCYFCHNWFDEDEGDYVTKDKFVCKKCAKEMSARIKAWIEKRRLHKSVI